VINKIPGIELIRQFEVPIAENFFKGAFGNRFILFLQRGCEKRASK